jgi:DNA-binding transcriptional LysR family regulator
VQSSVDLANSLPSTRCSKSEDPRRTATRHHAVIDEPSACAATASAQRSAVGARRGALVPTPRALGIARPLATERWLAHAHVTVRVGNEPTNVIEEELGRRGLSRRVAIEVPSFLAGLLVVARSDYLMNVPMPLVDEAAALLGLRLREAPIQLPRIRFALAWHPRFQADPAHQ